jgi:hypothetical protein
MVVLGEVASRAGVAASVHLDDEVEPSIEVREAVLRIARKATLTRYATAERRAWL